jgi:hypothetical protein
VAVTIEAKGSKRATGKLSLTRPKPAKHKRHK